MAREFLARHRRLLTQDLDEAREAVGGLWERHRSHLRRGRTYRLTWNQVELKNARLSYIDTPVSLNVECGPVSPAYYITLHESGVMRHRVNGRWLESTTGQTVIHAPGQELLLAIEPFRAFLLGLDSNWVTQTLPQVIDPNRLSVPKIMSDSLREISLDTPEGRAMRTLCRWMGSDFDQSDSMLLAAPQAASGVEAALLTVFVNIIDRAVPATRQYMVDDAERRVSRIEDWIDANYREPINVADLARVGGFTVRTMQLSFRRLRNDTPMGVVTKRRLAAAHTALSSPGHTTTVTDVAMDSGFFHFGRFAARYREIYGETPSQTLDRARRGVA